MIFMLNIVSRFREILQSKRWRILLGVLAGIFLLLGIGCLCFSLLFDKLFYRILSNYLVLLPGSEYFKTWQSSATSVYFSVYIYNLTNPGQVNAGFAPKFNIVGPYVYLSKEFVVITIYLTKITGDPEHWATENSQVNITVMLHFRKKSEITFVEWSSEPVPRSMFYRARYTYHFDPRSSVASDHTGTVTSLNLAYVFFPQFFKPFVTGTPHHVYWYNKDWGFSSSTNPAAFNMLNSTETKSDLIEMDTGVKDVNEIGQIRSVNRKSTLRVWENKEANRITGTDGSFARTGLKLGSTQDIYIPEVCRTFRAESIGMQPSKNYPDIELLKFSVFPRNQSDPHTKEYLSRYCLKELGCDPVGLVSAGPCMKSKGTNIPLYFSRPYFSKADPSIREKFIGIPEPNEDIHDTTISVEPTTGMVLEGNKRIQFNILTNKCFKGSYCYFPLAWVDESVAAERDTLEMIRFRVLRFKKLIPTLAIAFGCVFVALSVGIIATLMTFIWTNRTSTLSLLQESECSSP